LKESQNARAFGRTSIRTYVRASIRASLLSALLAPGRAVLTAARRIPRTVREPPMRYGLARTNGPLV